MFQFQDYPCLNPRNIGLYHDDSKCIQEGHRNPLKSIPMDQMHHH